ncbi:MAG: hypothetical protein COA47_06440 [Robiginitomaculum sp.]|nr:MAG: hypothetical protein COA47_06440 [Robiginitomaculum sp.]
MDRQGWGQLLQQASRLYLIAPHDFWKLSVWEWRQLAGGNLLAHATQSDFALLAARFPDQPIEDDTNGP